MGIWEGLMFIWYSLVSVLKFIARFLWVKDKQTVISGIQGVEFWPSKVTTANKFQIGDMKTIKKAIPNATVNDVLYGILWCGLTRYLNTLRDGLQFTGLCPVNLRERPGVQEVSTMLSDLTISWGNKFVMVLLPSNFNLLQVEDAKQPYYLSPIELAMLSIDPIQKGLLYSLNNSSNEVNYDRTKVISHLLEKLKHSLSLALVHFYPLAGRFATRKYPDEHACSVFVDCTKGPGARLIHAFAVDVTISDIMSSIDVPTIYS
ncbi:hypothetical protein BVRB_9g224550 [Beta vulgaris subsp. vulgaris]|uniref:O-acyltransferase WSD1 C-terminal domain-containing protein n=1 Tax=Beta vulgaris subsp. vulgaris TaxID=3555 RepID=A0A0J8B5M5_BETVV|nr:hypothetical protein BVRB_9g224550 [Beta vulgaris subsp. vulgaris]